MVWRRARSSTQPWRSAGSCKLVSWPDRIGDRVLENAHAFPLRGRADLPVAADLVDAPVDFEPVVVGIAELDRELAAGAAPALEIDRDAVAAQMVARAQHLVEGRHLEGEMVELDILRRGAGEPTSATP